MNSEVQGVKCESVEYNMQSASTVKCSVRSIQKIESVRCGVYSLKCRLTYVAATNSFGWCNAISDIMIHHGTKYHFV